jgi:predicted ATP-grasp superfamily ATP-dependent carboligase
MSERSGPRPTILLVGNYSHTVTAVRSLGAAGHRVIVGRAGSTWCGERSRFAAEVWDHPPPSAGPQFIEALLALLRARRDITAVFPMGDLDALALAPHAKAVSELATLVMPDPATVEACQDKLRMLEIAGELGIPHTAYAVVSDHQRLLAAADAIGYPCIVKPARASGLTSLLGRKAVICRTAAALRHTFPDWPAPQDELMVQGYASGLRHNLHFAAAHGRRLQHFESLTVRTDAFDGTGHNTEGLSVPPSPQLTDYTERLLRRLGYHGVGLTQFLVDDATGAVCFLELNPRLAGNTAFGVRAGLDLPALAVALTGLTPLPPVALTPALGVKFAWTSRDVVGLVRAVRRREVGRRQAVRWLWQIARTALTADVHCTWRWDDPLPLLAYYGGGLRGRVKRAVAGRAALPTSAPAP